MNLHDIRRQIDRIDIKLIKLINDRLELALKTKRYKIQITDNNRRDEILQRIHTIADTYPSMILHPDFTKHLFDMIMTECEIQQAEDFKLVGFQGEHGAFSDSAASTYQPKWIRIPCLEFSDVFQGVENSTLDFGIVPVENSLEGVVPRVHDLLLDSPLCMVGEISTPIHHCLLCLPEDEAHELRLVYSHPQALGQCRQFIQRHKLDPRPYYDTAGAAKMLAEQRPVASAVIANALCELIYDLKIVKNHIEDHESNSTRFVILAREAFTQPGNKCSIALTTKHEPGALFQILSIFAKANINLTRIVSRPIPGYSAIHSFLLDFEGSDEDKNVLEVLSQIQDITISYRFLGCYSSWIPSRSCRGS